MASPLRWFRRHATILMVVLGSAAMVIFGLGPVFDTLSRPSGPGTDRTNPVVAEWNEGKITRDDLRTLQMRHFQTQRFLEALQLTAMEEKGDGFQSFAPRIQPLQEGSRTQQFDIEQQLIRRMMLARKAESEGIVASDGVVNNYLAMFSGDVGFSENDLVRINQKANQGNCSIANIRRHLRLELLAQQMGMFLSAGIPNVPNPVEAIEFYSRVAEKVECDVLPISVDDYLTKTEKPDDLELKKIYEKGKFEYPFPDNEKPGFKHRNKVAVGYLVAENETFLQNEINKLTNEVVQKEYDRLVELEDDLVMEPIPDEEDDSIKIDVPPPGEKENSSDPAEESDPKEKSETEQEPESTPEESEHDDTENAESNEPSENTDSENTDGTPDDKRSVSDSDETSEDSSEPDTEGDGDEQSQVIRGSKSQRVAIAMQENGDDDTSEDSEQENAEQQESSDQENDSSDSTDPSGDDNQKPDEQDSDSEADAESENPDSGENQSDDSLELPGKDKIKKRVRPLKDVADTIKRSMAAADAQAAMKKAIAKASADVTGYYTERMKWEYDPESERGEEPQPIDFQSLAQKYNLVYMMVGLSTEHELVETELGEVSVPLFQRGPDGRPQLRGFTNVAELIFDAFDSLGEYDPQTIQDQLGQDHYVYWVSEKVEAKVPEFDEARPDVVKFWKSKRALELAMEDAANIATKVNNGQNLKALYPERASSTGEFSWFSNFGRTLFGNPTSVKEAGEEFMETTFSLAEGKAGSAPNRPKDTVYVIQMLSERQSIDELGNEFLDDHLLKMKRIPGEVGRVAQFYSYKIRQENFEELTDSMGLKFYGR